MKKLLIVCVIAVLSSNVVAADSWNYIEHDDDTALWVQKDSIWRSGGNVKMWSMHDHRVPSASLNAPPLPTTFLSTVSLFEYDCTDRRARSLQGTAYEDAKGSGRIAFTNDKPGAWEYIKPGSMNEKRWNIACKKT